MTGEWNTRATLSLVIVSGAAFLISAIVTGVVRKYALRYGVIDIPNERSSHHVPTPRGGGVSIVVTATLALIALKWLGLVPADLFAALSIGGAVVAIAGFADDRSPLPARVRIAVHLAAAAWALFWLGGLAPVRIGAHTISLGVWGYPLGVLGIVWVLNLFNFMDGIDGLAVTEATFIASAGALLAVGSGVQIGVPAAAFAFSAACCGFAAWNWPPAKIFMGDVGSGYLGYVIAVMGMALAREDSGAVPVWLILGAVFFADATVTLVRRLARGEEVQAAHRSHAYQWLARRWGAHRPVTLLALAVNMLWTLPCAWAAHRYPSLAAELAVLALVPLCALALFAGAGRRE